MKSLGAAAAAALVLSAVAVQAQTPDPTIGDRILAEYQQLLAGAQKQAIVNGALAADSQSRLKWVLDNWVPKKEDK